jgi:hypothetical protein
VGLAGFVATGEFMVGLKGWAWVLGGERWKDGGGFSKLGLS